VGINICNGTLGSLSFAIRTMFRESSELSLTRPPPGQLPRWVRAVIAIACLVTFVSVTVGSQLLWSQLPSWVDLGYFRHGLTFYISFWILVSFFPPWPMSRGMRVAVLLPIAHAVMIGCSWPVWTAVSSFLRDADAATAFAMQFPIAAVVGATAVGFAVIARLASPRRSGEWIHGFAMLALAELLLLGLWIPIACAAWPGGLGEWWSASEPLLQDAPSRVAFVVLPPTIVAIGFTVMALRRPRWLLASHTAIGGALGMLMLVAVATRLDASGRVMLLYTNFVPLLLAAALVAVSSLVVLGGVTWWRSWSMYRTFVKRERRGGSLSTDGDEPAIGLEITSWLRGPRVVQRNFTVTTSVGELPIRGAHLVASVPAATTQLKVGEQLTVLKRGDDVQVAGQSDDGGDPFRTSAAPLADTMYVAPAAMDKPGFPSVALVMWRPCVAYLLIVSAIAVPALAALLSSG
jgi:hypothetical protein